MGYLGYVGPALEMDALDLDLEMLLALPWQRHTETRQELFYSDVPRTYTYGSGRGVRTYESQPVPDSLRPAFERVAGLGLNVCFLNLYEDQGQHLGWHADDHEGTDHSKPIVVFSYGSERELWWRIKGTKGMVPAGQRVTMSSGSMFVMPPGFQTHHEHRVPKAPAPCGPRVSLTFRAFKEENPC